MKHMSDHVFEHTESGRRNTAAKRSGSTVPARLRRAARGRAEYVFQGHQDASGQGDRHGNLLPALGDEVDKARVGSLLLINDRAPNGFANS